MNCYNHQDKTAVGICPACHKGICKECGSKSEIFSCNKNLCLEFAQKISNIVNINVSQVKKANKNLKKSYITDALGGLFFVVMGCLFYSDDVAFGLTFMGFGFVFIAYAAYGIFSKHYRLDK